MQPCVEAYLDIETTGLSPEFDEITVIGINLCNGDDTRLIQLVGKDVTKDNVLEALAGVSRLYTYNGSRFDLPFMTTIFAFRRHHCVSLSHLHHCCSMPELNAKF